MPTTAKRIVHDCCPLKVGIGLLFERINMDGWIYDVDNAARSLVCVLYTKAVARLPLR